MCNAVRSQKGNDFIRRETTCVVEARKDRVDGVERLRNKAINSGSNRTGTAGKDLKTGSTLSHAVHQSAFD